MPLPEFLAELDALAQQAVAAFEAAGDAEALEAARVQFLGAKSGQLKAVQKGLGKIGKADKPAAGKQFNETKKRIEAAQAAAVERLARGAGPSEETTGFDPTVPGIRPRLGRLHPITQTIEELKDIMGRLGFSVAEGPEVEDQWHNFEALNIPAAHPARDPLDNFYLATAEKTAAVPSRKAWLLRSQTSTVQIRVMEQTSPPVRIISLGRVYRPDTADATHYPMFHQIEGLLVDHHVTMADLKSVLRLFARSFFEDDVHIRFRPSFFPFTEPSVEVDMSWQGGWIEIAGAGMVDPDVLRAVGYDPEQVTGFAFGVGIERICMGRHGIDDIREFYKNDVRFLRQF
ncbi:MAG: phenylalanine--tRNA ligase subunit alpha [Pirellulales bacterium]|nr:phenylalanine--tRNA ligase subunit alpha [Pirellulales bacterium]